MEGKWVYDSNGAEPAFVLPWAGGEPNNVNGGEDCACISTSRWNDHRCDNGNNKAMCEF